mgnify:CR=1 FL=1
MAGVRAAVQAMKPYVPGKPVEDVQRELGLTDLVKLNQNENPLGPSPRAVDAVRKALATAHTYPEGSARALRERLGRLWDLPADWFLVGNGSDEVFRLLAEVYLDPGDPVVVPATSFSEYRFVGELMGAEVIEVPLAGWTMDLPAMAEAAAVRGAKLLFLCRPNNPTGAVFPEADLRRALERTPAATLVVLDEAYREFDGTPFDSRALLLDYPNLVITRTFSKIYGMAGLRLGYGIMRPEVLAPLYTARDPFSVNGLAVAAGLAALDDVEHLERTQALTRDGKAYLCAAFARLGLPYVPSEANFVLFEVPRPASEVFNQLLRRGVLVRPCGSFGLPSHLRVSVGTAEENARFVAALEAVLGEG